MIPHDFAPFIIAAVHERRSLGELYTWPKFQAWGLLAVQEGAVRLQLAQGSQLNVTEGQVVLAQPGRVQGLNLPVGARYLRLTFDVRPRQRCLTRDKRSWKAVDQTPQPDAQALWGRDLPLLIPDACNARTKILIRVVTDRWWRGMSH